MLARHIDLFTCDANSNVEKVYGRGDRGTSQSKSAKVRRISEDIPKPRWRSVRHLTASLHGVSLQDTGYLF